MAGDWIKYEVGTSDKPEVWAIADRLGIDPDAVVGKLMRVWAWFDGHTENGNAPSVSKLLLDRLVGVSGFCAAVISEGWMLDDGKLLSLPNFDRHNGKTAKTRVLTAKRVANHKAKGNADGNGDSVSDALPREEKRRSKKKAIAFSEEDERLARWMYSLIEQAMPGTKKPNFESWANSIRIMRQIDNLTHRQIAEVFDWANHEPFWRTNILSPDKLREKYPQLAAKREESHAAGQRNAGQGGRSNRNDQALREYFAELDATEDAGTGVDGAVQPEACH